MPSRFDELPEDQAERIEREFGDVLEVQDALRREERDNKLQTASPIPPSVEGSRGLAASPQVTATFPIAERLQTGGWPLVCAYCKRTYDRAAFEKLAGAGVMGFIEKGKRSTLHLRDCACGNKIAHTEVE